MSLVIGSILLILHQLNTPPCVVKIHGFCVFINPNQILRNTLIVPTKISTIDLTHTVEPQYNKHFGT